MSTAASPLSADDPGYQALRSAAAWLDLCRLGIAPPEVWDKDRTTHKEGSDAQYVPPGQMIQKRTLARLEPPEHGHFNAAMGKELAPAGGNLRLEIGQFQLVG